MGLAERRAAKEFETNVWPGIQKEIYAAMSFDVPIEVKWDTLAVDNYGPRYAEFWPKIYFRPLIDAVKSICRDDMGKDALKGSLKKIVIQNVAGNYSAHSFFKLESGVLTLDHQAESNVDDVKARTEELTQHLESKL